MFVKKFNIGANSLVTVVKDSADTAHIRRDRINRLEGIDISAEPVEGFIAVVDRGHKNGLEIHAFFSDGTIRIYNYESHRFITVLFARPGQVERIMDDDEYESLPEVILEKCLENMETGKNYF